MSYQATVIQVMIASPGDVSEEREIIRKVLHSWNDVNSQSSKIMLASVSWESHSSPELGTRPQELINDRLLNDCDLLIGVFWTRLGTPTGKAESGTVEEIEKHIAIGKPAMIYFSSKPVAPESINADQFNKVKEVREKLKSKGLVETYENINEFEMKVHKQISICIIKNKYIQELINKPKIKNSENKLTASEQEYELSKEAISLLKAAASDNNGTILKISTFGGKIIQAGSETFGEGGARESAKMEAALDELEKNYLIVGRGYNDKVYELTHEGWNLADTLINK
ncbi:MAG: hypothetical protein IAE65_05290 [Ignavibacteria bacterium]|nr:hypothetical protein [Ignavibacteria bacterium]